MCNRNKMYAQWHLLYCKVHCFSMRNKPYWKSYTSYAAMHISIFNTCRKAFMTLNTYDKLNESFDFPLSIWIKVLAFTYARHKRLALKSALCIGVWNVIDQKMITNIAVSLKESWLLIQVRKTFFAIFYKKNKKTRSLQLMALTSVFVKYLKSNPTSWG